MKKLQIGLLALFAMFVFASMATATAFAEEGLWLANGNNIEAALGAITEGLVLLTVLTILGNVEVNCTGQFMGTVGPGTNDKITSVLGPTGLEIGTNLTGNALNCTVENQGICNLNELASLWVDNLPWTSTVELMAGVAPPAEFLDLIKAGGAGKEPGYEVQCNGITNLCEGKVSAGLENNAASKDVTSIFNEAAPISTEKAEKCETGSGDIFGEGLTFLENGETLTVSSP